MGLEFVIVKKNWNFENFYSNTNSIHMNIKAQYRL